MSRMLVNGQVDFHYIPLMNQIIDVNVIVVIKL